MSAGFLAYAVGVGACAGPLGRAFGDKVGIAASANAIASVAVAATPLDSRLGGLPHAIAAGATYASLAAIPALAARSPRLRSRRLAAASVAVAALSAASLALSATDADRTGLWQRTGLTLGHVWLAISALAVGRAATAHVHRRRPETLGPHNYRERPAHGPARRPAGDGSG
jgi:hypothetical protein